MALGSAEEPTTRSRAVNAETRRRAPVPIGSVHSAVDIQNGGA